MPKLQLVKAAVTAFWKDTDDMLNMFYHKSVRKKCMILSNWKGLNFVVWEWPNGVVYCRKDHVRHEHVSARQKWPETWGYLICEYKKLNSNLEGRTSTTPRTSSRGRHSSQTIDGVKLPKIPERLSNFPKTTSQEIGWKSTQNGHNAEMVTNFGEQRRGKCTIIRRLKWPKDGVH